MVTAEVTRHYTAPEVEGWIVDAHILGGIVTADLHDKVTALVDQANAAYEAQRRYERMMDQMLAGERTNDGIGRTDRGHPRER